LLVYFNIKRIVLQERIILTKSEKCGRIFWR